MNLLKNAFDFKTANFIITASVAILASCWLLFSIDKDTHHFSDLIKPNNLVVLVIYYVPTWIVSLSLFLIFKKMNIRYKAILALSLGIALSFTLIIICLQNLR